MKKMTAAQFREQGYLLELNRQFLHPLGLALEVVVEADGAMRFGEVWDSQDDPEGIVFDEITEEEATRSREIEGRFKRKCEARQRTLGYAVQPLP